MMTDPASPAIPPDARAVLTINLDAVRSNWSMLAERAGRATCAAVIKADAYGLGIDQLATALRNQGCDTFFVATLAEARRVRYAQPGVAIYVLDGLLPGVAPFYAGFDLRPCLSSLAEIEEWAAYCQATGRRLKAAIHIDTGMNRLGLPPDEVEQLAAAPEALSHFDVSLVMSHLACADEPDHPLNEIQRKLFDALRAKLPAAPASLANSGGIFLGSAYHYDLVRAGIAMFGGRAFVDAPNPMNWVVKLQARILQVRTAAEGATVGYGASFTVERPTRLATIACGYADGFLRALGGTDAKAGAVGYIGEKPVPIVGRVSMDLITVDVTDVAENQAARGAWVEVLGSRTTVDDLTDRAGTIGYELLTRLGRRVHRVYGGNA
jgi:alanine racemase